MVVGTLVICGHDGEMLESYDSKLAMLGRCSSVGVSMVTYMHDLYAIVEHASITLPDHLCYCLHAVYIQMPKPIF